MKRVLLGGIQHETNSFVPGVVGLDQLRPIEGEAIFGPNRGAGQEVDGILQVAREEGVEVIPTILAYGGANPPVADAAYWYVRERVVAGAKAHRDHLDGVVLPLHGAMTTESLEDPEGDLISAVREVVGPSMPTVVSHDMHAHPHVDYVDTGIRAMRGEVRPVVVQRKTRMMASAERHNTNQGPMAEIITRVRELEREPGILAATVFATQPWMDVTEDAIASSGGTPVLSLETDRLTIRSFRPDDWQELRELSIKYQASEAAKYEDPWPTSPEEVKGLAVWFSSGDDYLAVCLKNTGKLIGLVAINRRKEVEGRVHNLGYVFHPDYHGQGYAVESCRATMAYVFGRLAADGILTGTRAANVASVRLLKRLGLREKDIARGEYAISREEWLALERKKPDGG